MTSLPHERKLIENLLREGKELKLATQNYPSRGQTAIQKLYQTKIGKLFLKQVSDRNHQECRINTSSGSLAEREYWACLLANELKLKVPPLKLMDSVTTIQIWFDYPDARQYSTSQGAMELKYNNTFDCALFDWLTGQIDRHDANYLYNMVDQEIILIDSGHAFLKHNGSIPDYLRFYEAVHSNNLKEVHETKTLQMIGSFGKNNLRRLVPLRNQEEEEALFHRLQQLKKIKSLQDIINLYREKSL